VGHIVYAELVANVMTVVAQAGDTVAADDTLVILESMKMEIPVPAEVAGTVVEVSVREGQVVTEGDQIAEITET
jgi:biotin carboxyl carrier protein